MVVVGADGTVTKQAVTVGIRTASSAQILSGLSPASTVVTEGGYGTRQRDEGECGGERGQACGGGRG